MTQKTVYVYICKIMNDLLCMEKMACGYSLPLCFYSCYFRGQKYWHVSLFREIKTSKIKLLFFLQSHFSPWLYKNIFNVYILIVSLVYAHPRTMCFLILPNYYSLWTKRGSTFPLRLNIFRLHVSHCLLKVCLKKEKRRKGMSIILPAHLSEIRPL